MSFNIDGILHRARNTIYAPQGLILPAHLVNNTTVETEGQINYEEIEFLIEALREIKKERSTKPFGFKPNPVDKEETELVEKAGKLEQSLWGSPIQTNIQVAKKFIRVVSIINVLEKIAEKRNRLTFGFKKAFENNGDIKLADKALNLAKELKISCIEGITLKGITKPALEFIALIGIIDELEYIAKENDRTNLGFKQNPSDENEENIRKIASKLAEALKENFDPEILKTVLEFLNLAQAFTEMNKVKKATKVEKDNCIGFQCSLKNNQHALAI